ncbi:MAG: SDR family NAD(P)-dependent oxidoreductase [Pseudomonadota bacterium]
MSKPVALVTGASVGIGRSVAEQLAASGYDLVVLARRSDALKALAEDMSNTHGTNTHVIATDINDHGAVAAAIAELPAEFANPNVLVNNAGLALGTQPAQSSEWHDWLLMIQTNCIALVHLTHLLLPTFLSKNQGHIINIGSIAGNYPYKGGNVYGATKAFVDQFSANLRTDLLGSKVRVTNLIPGLLEDTEFSVVRMHGDEAAAKQVYADLEPLKPSDVAETVRWILSLPPRVNVNRIELMSISQSAGGLSFAATN